MNQIRSKRKMANKKTKTEKRTQGNTISISKIDCRPEFVCNTQTNSTGTVGPNQLELCISVIC